ncbi:heavy-metal-associated domain-containing protein [Alkalihalobacillus sp. AL-G]|uniref:heavy-metal-associated domain-containing protein n=1 Tax=Alkalihalobacillus sp. AL-G TaxID=2926399 RepID=UPI00272DA3EC|nr:heavy-metal-associated domain-containing protein [Alkalihalobacillus sp. AL-G]WLD94647.1 cation transporter [Alkalihalobacillus sp. AL-G]
MSDLSLHVNGMKCEECVETVENALSKLGGVERALADYKSGLVKIEYNDQNLKEEQIVNTIVQSGYTVSKEGIPYS